MMLKKIIVCLSVALFFQFSAKAQYAQPTRSVFVELGGPGLIYSFNYDFRFDKDKLTSWGMRIGAGGYARTNSWYDGLEREGILTIPAQVTRLFGKNKHYFEVGGGATFIYARNSYSYSNTIPYVRKNFDFILDSGETPGLMGTLNFGYRRIPEDGGFSFRANLTPLFNQNGFWPLFAGIGFGYAF